MAVPRSHVWGGIYEEFTEALSKQAFLGRQMAVPRSHVWEVIHANFTQVFSKRAFLDTDRR